MRFRSDPSGEPEGAQLIRAAVLLYAYGQDVSVVVIRVDPLARGIVEVGVGHVPLAVVVRVVARGSEPVTKRRDLALAKPSHARVVVALAEAICLGDSVDLGIVAGEDRRPARHTRERAGVVATEVDGVVLEPRGAGEC